MLRADQCWLCVFSIASAVSNAACAAQALHERINIVLNVVAAVVPRVSYCVH